MISRWWLIGGVAALAVVALAVVIVRWRAPVARPDPVVATAAAHARARLPVPAVPWTDITHESGVTFQHVSGASGDKLLPEAMGSGVLVLDFDQDGRPDLLFVNGRPWPGGDATKAPPTMALYRNRGDGRFEDVTVAAGLAVPFYGLGGTAGDYDNDGWPDLFLTGVGGDRLWHNQPAEGGGRRFVDVTEAAGLPTPEPWDDGPGFRERTAPLPFSSSAAFLDYDGDGRLDLFVARYVTWSPADDRRLGFQLAGLGRSYGPPTSFEGATCVLYRNGGDGRFEDVSLSAGVAVRDQEGARSRPVGKSLGVCVADVDDDGWPDVMVANDTVRNFLFHNVASAEGGRQFAEVGLLAGAAYADGNARGGMGIDEAQYRPDRRGFVIGNFANEPDTLLEQDRPGELLFADAALAAGIAGPSRPLLTFGMLFFDYDLDGRPDLFGCNGHLEPEIARVQSSQTYAQPPQLFWNTGGHPCFEPVPASAAGADLFAPLVGRGCAFADFDGDGDLDLVLTANGGPARLLRNDLPAGNALRLRLQGDGVRSNRDAVGAVVIIESGGRTQRQEVRTGRGYLSQSELTLTFGLGEQRSADRVTIRWPGRAAGPPTVLTNLAAGTTHLLEQATP